MRILLDLSHKLDGTTGDRAEALLGRLEAPLGMIASVHLALGADEEALDLLERAAEMREVGLPNITSEPTFDRLRDHPRFQALRAGMGLP